MEIREILDTLPHRYPFLLVDKVNELIVGERIVAQKNVTINEEFFNGHFPHYPVMPGVLIVEALAQAAGILSFKTMGSKSDENSVYFFVGIDNCRFKKPVVPGCCMSRLSGNPGCYGSTRQRRWWRVRWLPRRI